MNVARATPERVRLATNPVEVIAVLTVVVAFELFVVWFFFFTGHPVAG